MFTKKIQNCKNFPENIVLIREFNRQMLTGNQLIFQIDVNFGETYEVDSQ
jgi:hypothetical protein